MIVAETAALNTKLETWSGLAYRTTPLIAQPKKLDHKWASPFKIINTISSTAIKLKLPPHQKGIHPIVSVSNVQPYAPDEIQKHLTLPKPFPILVYVQQACV